MTTSADARWMRRALALARKAEGQTRPNPPVGAVVVKAGRVIGEGFHARAGQPHAEVEALNACRASPRGATLYVTLEPCSTTGRTPPCTERILRDGITRVVAACPDPNPRHAGAGLAKLTAAGLEVTEGTCRAQAEELIAPFAKHVTTGLPFVTLKLALTLDGRLADRTGASKWITGDKARREVQHLRRRADAVMVGAGTVCADNPSLLCRLPGADTRALRRVIVDASGRTPPASCVYTDTAAEQTIIATTRAAAGRNGKAWAEHGARVWTFTPDRAGRIPLRQLLRRLGKEGLLHVLCEGGAQLAHALHDANLVDDYRLFYAPLIMGNALLPALHRLTIRETRRIGPDLMIRISPTR